MSWCLNTRTFYLAVPTRLICRSHCAITSTPCQLTLVLVLCDLPRVLLGLFFVYLCFIAVLPTVHT